MPELPEVETVKRGLEPVMQGFKFERVTLNRLNLRFPFDKNFISRIIKFFKIGNCQVKSIDRI